MPAYNAADHIDRSIKSFLAQDFKDLELIIIDDGSTDDTLEIAKNYNDERINVFSIDHAGVSAARNVGLEKSRGAYLCFLDADDELPPSSISSRALVLDNDPELEFADGKVLQIDAQSGNVIDTYLPSFRGKVVDELIRYRSTCFCGNSWMIRRMAGKQYRFREDMSHAEDVNFYLSIAGHGNYGYTEDVVLYYRRSSSSAMNDLKGMEDGLYKYLKTVRQLPKRDLFSRIEIKYRLIRGVCGSYFKSGRHQEALKAFYKFLIA